MVSYYNTSFHDMSSKTISPLRRYVDCDISSNKTTRRNCVELCQILSNLFANATYSFSLFTKGIIVVPGLIFF